VGVGVDRFVSTAGIAAVAFSILVAAGSSAEAATYYYWPDNYGYYQPQQQQPRYAPRYRRKPVEHLPKEEVKAKEAKKPAGPVIIAISIEKQSLKVYDANGFFAESPISTGMKGHPTPMGVFSIIEKHKFHRSNIYSGAPMPYMQRITWSGVAMHAGVLPGYPASHGCIRLPMAFAVKLWVWTRMGARVVVTPGEITPASFSHPLLVAQKPTPPVASAQPPNEGLSTPKSDKAANAAGAAVPEVSSANLDLKPTIAAPATDQAAAPARETRTADASSALAGSAVTVSDATSTDGKPADAPASETLNADPASADIAKVETIDIKADDVKADVANSEAPKVNAPKAAETSAPVEKADDKIKAAAEAAPAPSDLKKDQTRASEAPKPAKVAATPPKRSGQIAVFISRKDSKLYVRQNLAPLFDVPVTIAVSDRPLGTHVFTARTDSADTNQFHWSVVTLPTRATERYDDDDRASRRRKVAGAVEVKPALTANTAAEALDRLTIPPDAMARIVDALSTGGSIVVSDQGIAGGETGEGTDFIVRLR
jgi:lipoprotein-anchoring transpeptidase ErfK/SrfK